MILGVMRVTSVHEAGYGRNAEGEACWPAPDRAIDAAMRQQALEARPRRRRLPPDLGERQVAAVAANWLARSFEAPAPNRKWIAD